MKSLMLLGACVALAACGHARTADEFRTDTDKLLATKQGDLKSCYDGVLKTTPGAAGKVTVTFVVEEKTGKITDPKVDAAQTTAPAAVSQCVLAALPSLTLSPADAKRGEATWSWDFSAPKSQ